MGALRQELNPEAETGGMRNLLGPVDRLVALGTLVHLEVEVPGRFGTLVYTALVRLGVASGSHAVADLQLFGCLWLCLLWGLPAQGKVARLGGLGGLGGVGEKPGPSGGQGYRVRARGWVGSRWSGTQPGWRCGCCQEC